MISLCVGVFGFVALWSFYNFWNDAAQTRGVAGTGPHPNLHRRAPGQARPKVDPNNLKQSMDEIAFHNIFESKLNGTDRYRRY